MLREDITSELLRMLESRYHFSERVYYHHAKVSAGALLARAVELAVVNELLVEEDFYEQTDASLLELLRRRSFDAPAASGSVGPTIRGLVSRFEKRKLLTTRNPAASARERLCASDVMSGYSFAQKAPDRSEGSSVHQTKSLYAMHPPRRSHARHVTSARSIPTRCCACRPSSAPGGDSATFRQPAFRYRQGGWTPGTWCQPSVRWTQRRPAA